MSEVAALPDALANCPAYPRTHSSVRRLWTRDLLADVREGRDLLDGHKGSGYPCITTTR